MKADILILCTGNSCRSQMAEGILQSLDPSLHVYSAGTNPAVRVHPLAVKVMNEIGIDLSSKKPKQVEEFIHAPFDFVITVCDNAKETCPIFIGKVQHRLHFGFDDPSDVVGTDEARLAAFRKTRDEIRDKFTEFYQTDLKQSQSQEAKPKIQNS